MKEYYAITVVSLLGGIFLSEGFLMLSRLMPVSESVMLMFGERLYIPGIVLGVIMVLIISVVPAIYLIEKTNKSIRNKYNYGDRH